MGKKKGENKNQGAQKRKDLIRKLDEAQEKKRARDEQRGSDNYSINRQKRVETQGDKDWDDDLAPSATESLEDPLKKEDLSASKDIPQQDDPEDITHYLWVLEPEDLEELSLAEVSEIWKNRSELCGSREVAAEALAILEVYWGIVDSYQGWQHYANREEIQTVIPQEGSLAEKSLSIEWNEPDNPEDQAHLVFKENLAYMSKESIDEAWRNRPESFGSIEAACQALAILREEAGITSIEPWQSLLGHVEIEKIKDDLPEEEGNKLDSPNGGRRAAKEIGEDKRIRRQQNQVIRENQKSFRRRVLENYNGTCCVTGTQTQPILEAAHVIPYSGPKSDIIENSLCLRVDIHRLFDLFLLTINPESKKIIVSSVLGHDGYYNQFSENTMKEGKIKVSGDLLSYHYESFKRKEREE